MNEFIIRKAVQKDIDQIVQLRLVNAKFHVDMVKGVKMQSTAKSFFLEQTIRVIDDPKVKILIGTRNGSIIAYAIGCIEKEHPLLDFGVQGLIDDVFVSPENQGHGYGSLLIVELNNWFAVNDVNTINLNVYAQNAKGLAFWNKHGYKPLFHRMSRKL